ncbi:glutamine synthetase family protein [Candidatus Spongiihabitans sp.]|uniref:glutamine synthetase family protein n=1 Tax=Candidatus Spongiihabitans sp. TaxID=3101308 RepID=UPI003C703D0A
MTENILNTATLEHIYVAYADIHGICRGKLLTANSYQSIAKTGMRNCCGVFSKDVTGTPVLETGILWEHGADDNYMRPCPETLRPAPWRDGCAMVIADVLESDGNPLPVAPRNALARVIEQFRAATGAKPIVGVELEFSLQHKDRTFANRGTQAYSLHQMTEASDFLDTLAIALNKAEISVEGIAAENCDGQYEVSLHYTNALAMADLLFQTKHIIKEIAQRSGYHATFMGLPDNGLSPNGLHVNVSLSGVDHAFSVAEDDTPSPELRRSIVGLLTHSNDALSLFLPTINAFKASVDGSFFPLSASWGFDNRSVLVRVPDRNGAGCRVEFRLPTADANPYLAVAGVLALMQRGLETEGRLSSPVYDNAFERNDLPLFDFSFENALKRLSALDWLADALGTPLMQTFLTVKKREAEHFQVHVTDWEKETYGTFF